jgi:hypothetical protein
MNEAAQEAERRRPGTCHHEAAHAVFAYHLGQPIAYAAVGEDSEVYSRVRYRRGDLESTRRVAAGILAGKYAETLANSGERKAHVPFEKFDEGIKETWHTNTPPAGIDTDEVLVYATIMTMGRQRTEEVYEAACAFAAEHVELWWDEIDTLAKRLLEVGRIDGSDVRQIIKGVTNQ